MATVDVECSECGVTMQLDETLLGTSMTCPKCKLPFVVERAGAYDLAEDPRSRPARSSRGATPEVNPEPAETEEQRALRERMERWAEGS